MLTYLSDCVASYDHMITLTYPAEFPLDGRTVKEHLDRIAQKLVAYGHVELNRVQQAPRVFWFLEFQGRGAPHFHLFTNFGIAPRTLSEMWYNIVGSDDKRHLMAGTRVEKLRTGKGGTVSYAAKYASKSEQKTVPAGFEGVGRFWGVYGSRFVLSASTFIPADVASGEGDRTADRELFVGLKRRLAKQLSEGRIEAKKVPGGMAYSMSPGSFAGWVLAIQDMLGRQRDNRTARVARELLDSGIDVEGWK
jgi:hypothetical protein